MNCIQMERADPAEHGTPELATQLAETAEDARDAGCYRQADRLFEGAHFILPRARYIYERILLQEVLGQHEYAHEMLDGYRAEQVLGDSGFDRLTPVPNDDLFAALLDDATASPASDGFDLVAWSSPSTSQPHYPRALVDDPSITDLAQVETRLLTAITAKVSIPEEPEEPEVTEEPIVAPVAPPRSTVNTVGPIALGAAGAVSLGFAVYGLTAKCSVTRADGECLDGQTVGVAPTTAYAVGGVIGVVGAAVWWIASTPKAREHSRLRPTATGISLVF